MKKLDKRKALASKVLGVGKNKIRFDSNNLASIKEAITKQDIRDLFAEGIITIREKKGRRKAKEKRKTNRGFGKIRMKVTGRKQKYVKLVRKQRRHVKELKKQGKLNSEENAKLRKMIKSKIFKSKAHLNEYIGGIKK